MTSLLKLWLWVALLAPPPDEAREVASRVAELVEAGKLDAALRVIEEANARAPDPRYIYMRASLEEQLGHCNAAIALYRAFLRSEDLEPADVDGARRGLERCGATPEPVEEAAPSVPAPRPVSRTVPESPRVELPPPVSRDPWSLALATSGPVLAVVGAGLWGAAALDVRAARNADRQSAFQDLSRRSERLEIAGATLVSVGTVLIISGIARIVSVTRRRRLARERTMLEPTVSWRR